MEDRTAIVYGEKDWKKDEIIETRIDLSYPVSPTDSDLSSLPSPLKEKGDLEAQATPELEPTQRHLGFIRFTVLNVYRRLFTLAFIGNIIPLIVYLVRGAEPLDLVNASAINLAVCGLCRQPIVLNLLYLIFGSVPRSAPTLVKRLACRIFHLGGVHSGTGVASFLWYIGFAGMYTYRFNPATANPTRIAVLVLIYSVFALLLSIIVVAHPAIRRKYHDVFELVHRFANWGIIALFWALLFLLGTQEASLGTFLLNLPAFWILIILTVATVHPWLLLRKVTVTPEPLSPHAIRLHFDHTTVKFGQGIQVAKHPLKDWHSFACFPDHFDNVKDTALEDTKFSCIVSRVGDWTKDTIVSQPTKLWKRGVPTYGFGYVFRMFSRIIVVTTGSGIGPCLSFLEDENRPKMRVLWQTRSPLKTYGQRTLDLVSRMDQQPVIIDTSEKGKREEMLPQVLRLVKEFDAEAVCVISNPAVTKEVVFGLEMRGILAYGPIFDS
ncbi:hypothetical protein QBC40DRAFT_273612 [Triangularia verruculosa]|uniref:Integral membrane protein TmpA n=1 Tax=Triangularia verruculosa TaxID=2587418 RepID=A0AAN6XP24_9PEZI|nr:hypothetical protein QBC40DRAFT_273612 [Triangularia verruculosa]